MNASNLLVELFVEELPPKALQKLGDAFATVLFDQLKAQGLLASSEARLTAYASPRRLAVHITEVLSQGEDKAVSQKLMPVSVGLDAEGRPTPALLKKLAALGVDVGADESAVTSLKRQGEGKAEALFYESTAKGVLLTDGVQKALDEAVARLPIPKVMRYQLADGWSSVNFVRPAHGLVVLHGTQVLIGVKTLGLTAGPATHGHRFEAAVDPVVIHSADSYAGQLREEGAVIASFTERRAEIARQLQAAAERVGGGVRAIEDEALLDEVTALVERPNVLVCAFEKEFLDVPQECLILTMKANQKYFPLLAANGKLTNQFLVVSNISPSDASAVIGGNERVVRPRLADAKFFFDQDRKKTLASRVELLDKVVYHNKLGTQGERIARVRAIAKTIAQQLGNPELGRQADQAAMLAKTDLVTDMVGEFPELQGIMGRYYAQNDGLDTAVADAIEDHYKPRFAGDELPRGDVGVVVALADKLETLVGMFGIGNLPTGDRDPFALRRHALGVIRMLVEKDLELDLETLLVSTLPAFGDKIQDATPQLVEFIYDRLANMFREQGYSAQEVEAVLALQPQRLSDVQKRLEAVRAFAALPEAPALAAANKRVGNILKKAETAVSAQVNEALLAEQAEKDLYTALQAVAPKAQQQFAAGDYTASLQTLAALRASVDAFFEHVMVNAEDLVLRANRLGLLATLHEAMNRVADLARLAV
jgi:glycyl-tRNA synthetase beta chain